MEIKELFKGFNTLMVRKGYEPLTEEEFIEQISTQVAEGKLTVTNREVKANEPDEN